MKKTYPPSSFTSKITHSKTHPHKLTIRNISSEDSGILLSLFKDSHLLFKIRIEKLGDLDQITSNEESEIMRIMLEGLIAAKKQLMETKTKS